MSPIQPPLAFLGQLESPRKPISSSLEQLRLPIQPTTGLSGQGNRLAVGSRELVAVRRLRANERLQLPKIKARLSALTPQELEAYATADLPAGDLASALGVQPKQVVHDIGPKAYVPPLNVNPDRRWTRLDLAVGLELHIRDDVTLPVIELAKKIWSLAVYGEQKPAAPVAPPPADTTAPPAQPQKPAQ